MRNFLALLLMMLFAYNSYAQIDLSLNLQKGETYTQYSYISSGIEQNVNGQQIAINMKNEVKNVYKVSDIVDDIFILDVTFEELKVELEMGPQSQSFTSSQTTDPMSKILHAMTQSSFTMKLGRKGKVHSIEGMEAFWQHVVSATEDIPALQRNQMITQLKQSYGDEQLASSSEAFFAIYPTEKVKQGESWVINTTINTGFIADVTRTFTLEEIHKNFVVIKGVSKISTDPNNKEFVQVNGMPTRFEITGDMTSTFTLNAETGWIKNSNVNQKIEGTSIMQVQGQEMNIPLKMESTSILSEEAQVK